MSDTTAEKIDLAIRELIDRNYQRAEKILNDNIDILHLMAKALMKYETIDSKQIAEIMAGKEPTPPEGWDIDVPDDNNNEPPANKKDKDIKSSTIGGPAEQS